MSYRWIPADSIPQVHDTWLFVTYERNNVSKPEAVGEGKNEKGYDRSIIKCPDRTLVVCNKEDCRPMDTSFDEAVGLTLFDSYSIFNDIAIGAVCVGEDMGRNISEVPSHHKIIACHKSSRFVDPYHALSWMNSNANVGCIVSICPRDIDSRNSKNINPEMKASLEIQKSITKIFKMYRRPGLNLMNVIHGYSIEQYKAWADAVDDEVFDSWAIGSESSSLVEAFGGILYLHNNLPREHYHLFNSGSGNAIALSWLGKYAPLITSDDNSYLTSANIHDMQLLDAFGVVRTYSAKIKEYASAYIPCCCEVCNKIRYMDVLALPPEYKGVNLLAWHNMITLHRQAQFWSNLAQTCKFEDYVKWMEVALSQEGSQSIRKAQIRDQLKSIEDFVNKKPVDRKTTQQSVGRSVVDLFGGRNQRVTDTCSISVDILPNYYSYSTLREKFGIDVDKKPGYDDYLKVKHESKKIEDKESLDRKVLRKFPHKHLKELRMSQLKQLEGL